MEIDTWMRIKNYWPQVKEIGFKTPHTGARTVA